MLLILVTLLTTFGLAWSFYHRRYSYWSSRGIPGPSGTIPIGNLSQTARASNPVALQVQKWTKEYGSVYGFYEGTRRVLVVNDPDMLHELFVKKYEHFYGRKGGILGGDVDNDPRVHVFEARGARWKRLRTLATPAFSAGSLKKILPTVEDSALEMINHLEQKPDGEAVNILEFYQEYTMDVICRIAMGQKGSKQFDNQYSKNVLALFNRSNYDPLILLAFAIPSLAGFVRFLLVTSGKLFGTSPFVTLMGQVTRAVEERIQERENGEESSIDFIDLFLDAKADDVIPEAGEFKKENIQVQRAMSKLEIVAQCFVFLLAGFDTTANSLTYASYLIAKNPRVLQKLQDEIDRECTEESISYESISRMNYMDCVVKEALRMYPLAAFACARECMVDSSLGGVPIEKGTYVTSDAWSVHYDKQLWGDDAEEFRPERWESSERRALTSWFPFGIGPRQCIGLRLAMMEEKLALAHLLRKYNVVAGPATENELKLGGCFTTSPQSVNVYLKKRDM